MKILLIGASGYKERINDRSHQMVFWLKRPLDQDKLWSLNFPLMK